LLRTLFEGAVRPGARVIDSAESAAQAAAELFNHPSGCPIPPEAAAVDSGTVGEVAGTAPQTEIRCFATDSVEKFERLGSRFLGRPVGHVELVDLGG
jgi:glutamate racemase